MLEIGAKISTVGWLLNPVLFNSHARLVVLIETFELKKTRFTCFINSHSRQVVFNRFLILGMRYKFLQVQG